MYNLKKRFGTIDMTKEIEETILNDTKQIDELLEENKKLRDEISILIGKEYKYKEDIKKLQTKIKEYDLHINSCDKINIVDSINKALDEQQKINDKNLEYYRNTNKKQLDEIKELRNELYNNGIKKLNIKEHDDGNDLINKNNELNKKLAELNDENKQYKLKESIKEELDKSSIDEQNIEDKYFSKIEELKQKHKEEIDKIKNNIPISSNSSENKNNKDKNSHPVNNAKHRFENKKLPIMERCNVVAYKYDTNLNNVNNKKRLQVLEFISSEHKVLVRFNSSIAEQVDDNDKEMWEEIYNFKIENGELKDASSNKTNFKYKVKRCKELYDKYGENLSRFQIYVNYLGKLTQKEWEKYLEEFDKLYNSINIENMCQYKYKNDKNCGRINCNIKHKEVK